MTKIIRPLMVFLGAILLTSTSIWPAWSGEPTNKERHLLYVAVPGIRNYLQYGGAGILVFDMDQGHHYVKRIETPASQMAKPENIKGICASAKTQRLYFTTLTKLYCLDLRTEKTLWEKALPGGCDRMSITPDGEVLYVPSLEGPHWNVVDAATGDMITQIVTNSGAHNTICSLDGSRAYLAGLRSRILTVVDTKTQKVVQSVGPFDGPIRPFTVNAAKTLCIVNVNDCLGFEIGDLTTGKMLHRVEVENFEKGIPKRHGCPSHGVGLTPDEKEIWVVDAANSHVHVFDARVMPPKQTTSIKLREQPGWVTFSLDGRYAYPSTGEAIDTQTKRILAALQDEKGREVHSEKMVEIVFQGDTVVRTGDQFGLGRAETTKQSSAPQEPDRNDTRLLSQPAVSARHIAFIYADDLWVADLDGRNPRRLTTDIGIESHPVFSPDGKTIAFSAEYDGNRDVFLIPVGGGAPTRLTAHPDPDIARGFTPDGKAVLFSSPRHVFTVSYTQLFTVPLQGGMPTQLPIPNAAEACYSPDGSHIAYTPIGDHSQQWKHYRGGTHSRIWIYDCHDHGVVQIPQPDGCCNDLSPQWIGDTVYFRSDREGEYNLFAYDTKSKSVRQLTRHNDFPVLHAGSGGGRLIYEQAGYLHLFDPNKNTSERLKIGVASDLVEARPRFVRGAKHIRNAGVSPSGARAVFAFRGEIVTVPAAKGDPHNLTQTPGVHERFPAWSPDGRSIAYFSDEGGEYQLHVRAADGKGKVKKYEVDGAGFFAEPVWSPDNTKIAYIDNSQSLYCIDLGSGQVKKIAPEPVYGPADVRTLRAAWSPDSKWIVYSLGNKTAYHTIFAYDMTTDKSRPITDGLSDALDPVFDASGKYLYFLASTDAGPANQWFAQSNADMRIQRALYLVVLKKDVPSPLARENDEEKPDEKKKEDSAGDSKSDQTKSKPESKPKTVDIDFDGIDQRIVVIPVPAADYIDLRSGSEGQVYYRERSPAPPRDNTPRPSTLHRFDLSKRKSEKVLEGIGQYHLTRDGKKALVWLPPESWSIIDVTGSAPAVEKGKLKIDAIEVRIDPRAEWREIFHEAWRINRDYFYDPHMHGADWPAIRTKYEVFLPHLATRGDLDRVLRWMLSELAVGHSFLTPGERLHERKRVPGGLLGADYEIANGRYRFKKVYGGLNWNPELRAPLTAPGVGVKAGEYLLAVRGIDLKPPTEIYTLFENTADKSIDITVGPNADGKDSRTVTVEPLASEAALRNRDWVEGNLKKVHQATGGRVAYVYVPNTAALGHAYFKRYFFPQADKQAIIVDERFNQGGQVADYYIDLLRRPFTAMWATRYGEDIRTPEAAIFGPKVMLIDETAGSGGDLLPWMFRKNRLGPLVGKRTWGGLVGILGFPALMDGGRVTAPDLAFWTEDGFAVENEGVPPDVEVEQWPAEVIAGKDPQLDKAIAIMLEELDKHPPQPLKRPTYRPFPAARSVPVLQSQTPAKTP